MLEILSPVLQGMGMIFILLPPAALIPAGLFGFLFYLRRQIVQLVTALLWLVYTVYESLLQYGGLCSGECNIRVDLLLVYPLLLGASLLALVMLLAGRGRDR